MILYHGSTVTVYEPRILQGIRLLDFGAGFYATSSYEQARRWAMIKMRRENKNVGFVSVYDFDEAVARTATRIDEYKNADENWLRFVVQSRTGTVVDNGADIHIGPVADDNVYASVRLFEAHVLNEEETVKRLKTEKLHDQIVFHTQRALAYLRFVEAREILGGV